MVFVALDHTLLVILTASQARGPSISSAAITMRGAVQRAPNCHNGGSRNILKF